MSEPKQPYRIAGRPQTIYRTVKNVENPFVMIDRRPIDNPGLSFKAKGILTYLMSRPDGWEVSVADLINHTTEGEASVRSGLKQLKAAGHMKYTKMRDHGRITGWLIEVYESPHLSPDGDFQDVEKPHVGNRTQVLLNVSNTESTTTTPEKKSNIFSLYESNIGPLTPLIADALKDAEKTYSSAWVERAIPEAALSGVRNMKYILGVLDGYKRRGSPDIGRDKTQYKHTPAKSKVSDVIDSVLGA
jgi:hypothetical protein